MKVNILLSVKAHRKFPKNESHSWFSSKNKEDRVQQFCYFVKVKKKKSTKNILRFFSLMKTLHSFSRNNKPNHHSLLIVLKK